MAMPTPSSLDWNHVRRSIKRALAAPAAAALLTSLTGCGGGTAEPGTPDPATPPGQILRSDKPRLTAGVPEDDTRALAEDNAGFAFDLLANATGNENFFMSPHSISTALAMTYGGARGETARQMKEALRFQLPGERLHASFGALDLALAARNAKKVPSGQAFELHVINSLWGQRDYVFLDAYLDLLAENYGAGLSLLDFRNDAEASRGAINGWVSDQTRTRIPELIPMGVVDAQTVLVLTNAIYFAASWKHPFEPADTKDGEFVNLDDASLTVPTMHHTKEHRYAEGDGWQALELAYAGDDVSMLILLPDAGTFQNYRAKLEASHLAAVVQGLHTRIVDVSLPKFRFSTQLDVKTPLQALGMTDAFQPGIADFSGMDGTRALVISDIVHEAFIAVDEKGTEAAAATAVVVGRVSIPQRAVFNAERPFVIVIRDKTGAVLFVGQVVNP
jgi:serpin B